MYYDEESGSGSFITGLLIGALLGASLALLTVPESGRSTRQRLVRAVRTGRVRGHGEADDLDDVDLRAAMRAGRRRARS